MWRRSGAGGGSAIDAGAFDGERQSGCRPTISLLTDRAFSRQERDGRGLGCEPMPPPGPDMDRLDLQRPSAIGPPISRLSSGDSGHRPEPPTCQAGQLDTLNPRDWPPPDGSAWRRLGRDGPVVEWAIRRTTQSTSQIPVREGGAARPRGAGRARRSDNRCRFAKGDRGQGAFRAGVASPCVFAKSSVCPNAFHESAWRGAAR